MNDHLILVVDGEIDGSNPDIGSIEQQKDRIRRRIRQAREQSQPLVIHFHGGLVSQQGGISTADVLDKTYSRQEVVTLFAIWPTDIIHVIKNNLDEIFSIQLARKALRWLLKRYGKRTIEGQTQKGLKTMSFDDDQWLKEELSRARPFEALDELATGLEAEWTSVEESKLIEEMSNDPEIQALLDSTFEAATSLTPDLVKNNYPSQLNTTDNATLEAARLAHQLRPGILIEDADSGATNKSLSKWVSRVKFKANWMAVAARIIANVIERKLKGTAHTWYATLVEEFIRNFYGDWVAEKVWSVMKKDARDAFEPGGNTFGRFLLDQLNQQNVRPRIVLSAHSAGSIFAAHLIENDISSEGYDVIWVAPAINYQSFSDLLTNHQAKIRNFRMFAMKDHLEKSDILIRNYAFLYPSSLLYLVSGICEEEVDQAILGMHRFYRDDYRIPSSRREYVHQVREYLNGGENRVVWSNSSLGDGLNSSAVDHGDFDTEEETLKSISHILREGF